MKGQEGVQKQDAGTQGSLSIPATQFTAHKHTSLLDFFTTSHKLFCLPSLMHVLIHGTVDTQDTKPLTEEVKKGGL